MEMIAATEGVSREGFSTVADEGHEFDIHRFDDTKRGTGREGSAAECGMQVAHSFGRQLLGSADMTMTTPLRLSEETQEAGYGRVLYVNMGVMGFHRRTA